MFQITLISIFLFRHCIESEVRGFFLKVDVVKNIKLMGLRLYIIINQTIKNNFKFIFHAHHHVKAAHSHTLKKWYLRINY